MYKRVYITTIRYIFPTLWIVAQIVQMYTTLINFEKKHYYKKRGSDIYHKSNYAAFYIKLRQDFCISSCDDNKVYKVLSVTKNH